MRLWSIVILVLAGFAGGCAKKPEEVVFWDSKTLQCNQPVESLTAEKVRALLLSHDPINDADLAFQAKDFRLVGLPGDITPQVPGVSVSHVRSKILAVPDGDETHVRASGYARLYNARMLALLTGYDSQK